MLVRVGLCAAALPVCLSLFAGVTAQAQTPAPLASAPTDPPTHTITNKAKSNPTTVNINHGVVFDEAA